MLNNNPLILLINAVDGLSELTNKQKNIVESSVFFFKNCVRNCNKKDE